MRFHIIRNARIDNAVKYQSCMVSKVPMIYMDTDRIQRDSSPVSLQPSAAEMTPNEQVSAQRTSVSAAKAALQHSQTRQCDDLESFGRLLHAMNR